MTATIETIDSTLKDMYPLPDGGTAAVGGGREARAGVTIERSTFTYEPSQYTPSGWEWRVRVQIRLRRVSDGAEVELNDSCGYPADEDGDTSGPEYMWSLGNYACDCNRHLFFERALGNEPDDETCGHGAYEVVAPQWLSDACAIEDEARKRDAEEQAKRGPSRPLIVTAVDVANGVITLGEKR